MCVEGARALTRVVVVMCTPVICGRRFQSVELSHALGAA
jgi:hypothetical protein